MGSPFENSVNFVSNKTQLHPDAVSCVYPISGQFDLLNRILLYILLLFGFSWRRSIWLVNGATAYVTASTGTAAIHAVAVAAVSRHHQMDLDAFGVLAIILPSLWIALPLFRLSKTIGREKLHPIIGLWSGLIALGLVASTISVWAWKFPTYMPCYSSKGDLILGSPTVQELEQFQCNYSCLSSSQHLRSPDELVLVRSSRLVAEKYFTIFILIPLISGTIVSVLLFVYSVGTSVYNIAEGKYASSFREVCKVCYEQKGHIMGFISVIITCVVISLGEVHLMVHGGLPTSEQPYAVGQWSPWVSATLTVMAAIISKIYNVSTRPPSDSQHGPQGSNESEHEMALWHSHESGHGTASRHVHHSTGARDSIAPPEPVGLDPQDPAGRYCRSSLIDRGDSPSCCTSRRIRA